MKLGQMQEFKEGHLYYVHDFPFKNGNIPKNKFFLVLKDVNDEVILASLPTSQDHIPQDIELETGAYNIPDRFVSAYVFKANDEIAMKDGKSFSFSKNTFVYGAEIDSYPKDYLDGYLVECKGKINNDIFADVISNFKDSPVVKRKYKKLL